MLLTEAEAKKKWCPFARVDSTASNRPNHRVESFPDEALPKCLASDCCIWRWALGGRRANGAPALGYCGGGSIPERP